MTTGRFRFKIGYWTPAVLVLFVLGSSTAAAETITLRINEPGSEEIVTFDTERISEAEVRRLITLSPGFRGLAIAIASGDPDAPDFLDKYRATMLPAEERLKQLNALHYPEELRPVVEYEKQLLSFTLWLARTRYEFYRAWKIEALEQNYEDLKVSELCASQIAQIRVAPTFREKYELSSYDWYNCVDHAFMRRRGWHRDGGYPLKAWERFLKAYGIEAKEVGPPD